MVNDSPIQMQSAGRSDGTMDESSHPTQSSLGLAALLASSQGVGLAEIGGESLLDDSKIKLPPAMEEVDWDSEGDDL